MASCYSLKQGEREEVHLTCQHLGKEAVHLGLNNHKHNNNKDITV